MKRPFGRTLSFKAMADAWREKQKKRMRYAKFSSPWWHFTFTWGKNIDAWINAFLAGKHSFQPMREYVFKDEVVQIWCYKDRLMIYILQQYLKPTFQYIISKLCVSTRGPCAIKEVTRDIEKALKSGQYYYALRIDIKGYYANIQHQKLLELLQKNFDDPLILKYLHDIVKRLVDRDGVLFSPEKGIPLRSTLSPFFGALYLTPLDEAFSSQDVFYRRYVDDIIILVKNERQYRRARKRLFEVLRELHLEVSPQKTRMGKLDVFHFLGVKYEASRNPQNSGSQVTVSMHPRCCSRARNLVIASIDNAVHAADIQRYLVRWATWWQTIASWSMNSILLQWTEYASKIACGVAWYGRGLVSFERCDLVPLEGGFCGSG
jgi:hypothetical protein